MFYTIVQGVLSSVFYFIFVITMLKFKYFGVYSDVRLKKFTEERNSYIDEINRLKLELQEAKRHSDNHYNGTDSDDLEDAQSKIGFVSIAFLKVPIK